MSMSPSTESEENVPFDLAYHFVLHTRQSVFITGKAGTGKTTFLKKVVQDTTKKMAVAAPTGVAAINAGGVTLHSLFQLPFQPFLPTPKAEAWHRSLGMVDQKSLFTTVHLSQSKIEVLQQLDTLIIDEVSMVRADMMDAIHTLLQHHRHSSEPFGGVQVVCIGDLYQLPPVCKSDEWSVLQLYYDSPFFFDAKVIQHHPPALIELDKVYRQKASTFLEVLNRIRSNHTIPSDLDYLNQWYDPGFRPTSEESYITLTTHNEKSESINRYRLKKLKSPEFTYTALIQGEFSERMFPVEPSLTLKVGAQVMFIKNDKGDQRKFYNGLLAKVTALSADSIEVCPLNDDTTIKVEREVWKNIRYAHDKSNDRLEEEELGTFAQYPLRLAWAITIHKSQGLTFDRAVIDAGESFASGQVYVALSRLTSTDQLKLLSKITPTSIQVDTRICAYMDTRSSTDVLSQLLREQQQVYLAHTLSKSFDWEEWLVESEEMRAYASEKQLPDKDQVEELWSTLDAQVHRIHRIAQRFLQDELQRKLIPQAPQIGYAPLQDRVAKAVAYLENEIITHLQSPLAQHIKAFSIKKRVKQYVQNVRLYDKFISRRLEQLWLARSYADALANGTPPELIRKQVRNEVQAPIDKDSPKGVVKSITSSKGETQKISLQLFKEGKSIEEIAALRGMAASTIEGHLVHFIPTGEVDMDRFVTAADRKLIEDALDEIGIVSLTAIRDHLKQAVGFGQIKAVLTLYQHRLATQKNSI
ncbi:MAG: helix-turn-helix domain-containing protein [Cytophagaceae bacterium]|nr:helix-turn-helix domain-containing protein [Cytophagaceae bacterium]